MKRLLFIFCIFCLASTLFAQTNIDSIFHGISNKEIYVSPVFGGEIIWKENKNGEKYPARQDTNRRMFRVSTFDRDIQEVADSFSEKKVSLALFRLLSDPNKDLYANALLYELLDNKLLGKLVMITRDNWIESGKRDSDLKHWQELLRSKGYLD